MPDSNEGAAQYAKLMQQVEDGKYDGDGPTDVVATSQEHGPEGDIDGQQCE